MAHPPGFSPAQSQVAETSNDTSCPLAQESLFLAFRRFRPIRIGSSAITVTCEHQILSHIERSIKKLDGRVGLLLSGGMDSAILARFLPKGAIAYTIDYDSIYNNRSEYEAAAQYIPDGVTHKRVYVNREQFIAAIETLTKGRKAPTVPHEPAVFIAAQMAQKDGVNHLIGGFGADGRLGGFPALHANSDRRAFQRILFSWYINPTEVLVGGCPIDPIIDYFTSGSTVDVQQFLTMVGTEGTSVSEAISLAGIDPIMPYLDLTLGTPVNPSQPSKYFIQKAFKHLYGELPVRESALWIPYSDWLSGIEITRPEFVRQLVIERPLIRGEPIGTLGRLLRGYNRFRRGLSSVAGSRRLFHAKTGYMLYSLERFLEHKELNGWRSQFMSVTDALESPEISSRVST